MFVQAHTIGKFRGMHNREQTMKHFAFVIGALAVGLAAATPARADYAVVRWSDGYCHIWWGASATPWGDGWTKIAIAPDWSTATAALDAAIHNNTCR
jgi:hypothetical protein